MHNYATQYKKHTNNHNEARLGQTFC